MEIEIFFQNTQDFFSFSTKYQDNNHLKFGEALYFYIYPYFGPKTLFNHIHTLLYPNLAISSIFLLEMKNSLDKKIFLSSEK